jgi:hypothetical protein
LTRIPCRLIDPENANRSGSDNTRRSSHRLRRKPYMTGLKCSIEQRTVGKQRGCNVRVGRATGMGQQAVVVHLVANSASRPSRSTRQREQDALREVLDRQPDCQIRRQAPRPDHLSCADLVTSWCGQPQHDLTSTRQPVWAHKPSVQLSGFDRFQMCA